MVKISVVINTLNEGKNLSTALKSVNKLADEIIVVDMHSDDDTLEVAKKSGAKVYLHKKMGYVEPARNYAIEKATSKWVFILDADETIPKTLIRKLRDIAENVEYDYVAIPRRNLVFGKWLKHSRWWPDYNVRFFKKDKVKWGDEIHSIPKTQGKGLDLEAKKEYAITHNNYVSISQFIKRMDRYTSIQSKELVEGGYKFKWEDLIKKPIGEFVSRFFRGFGYKDGVHGLALSLMQAFSEGLVYMKVWEDEGFKKDTINACKVEKQMRDAQKEVNYWISDMMLREKGGIIYKIRRKLKI